MGIRFEVKEKVSCLDYFCVARAILEIVAEKIGIEINTKIEREIEEELGKLLEEGQFGGVVTFKLHGLKIDIYSVRFDILSCDLDGCTGYLTATVDVEALGNNDIVKQVVKKLLRDIGADKYVKICE
jgi:hypothetical protein